MTDNRDRAARRPAPAAQTNPQPPEPPGRAARRLAVFTVDAVLARGQSLDEAFNNGVSRLHLEGLEGRDRAFARLMATATLRHLGRLEAVVKRFIEKPLPDEIGRLRAILGTAAAQLLLLKSPPHAVISQTVDIVRLDPRARRFDGLSNAVLRRVSEHGADILAALDGARLDMPDWLYERWVSAYGQDEAHALAVASLIEAPLDLTVKAEAAAWAEKLSGIVLPSGSVRVREAGRIEALPGYDEGAWWVQDAAAALPVRLLGDVAGRSIADLCAAPGGKTAQLASAGAHVTAVDASGKRLERLTRNMERLKLDVRRVQADAIAWSMAYENRGRFDAVLLDAPCSATGTIRRHPDLLRTKDEGEIDRLAQQQRDMLEAAAHLVKDGGQLIYVTCSMERAEGPAVIATFLEARPDFTLQPVSPATDGIAPELIRDGFLRTAPHLAFGPEANLAGMDGFFAARLMRRA